MKRLLKDGLMLTKCERRLVVLVAALLATGSRLSAQADEDTAAQSQVEAAAPTAGATTPTPAGETAQDEDPTRTVLFNARLEYRDLLDGASAQILTLRRDVAIPAARTVRPHHKYALLRFDLPLARVDRGGVTESGLGDFYFQALHVHPFRPGFALAYGSGLLLPTASEDSLGTGKWVLAPAVVPVWFLPKIRGLAYVKVQDFFSVAGDETRPDLHVLAITPALQRRLGQRGFMTVDSESRTNWREDGQTSFMSGVLLGRVLSPRWGFWAKVEVPWGEHRAGDWTLRTSLVRRDVR